MFALFKGVFAITEQSLYAQCTLVLSAFKVIVKIIWLMVESGRIIEVIVLKKGPYYRGHSFEEGAVL
jgi:hypothetical protein